MHIRDFALRRKATILVVLVGLALVFAASVAFSEDAKEEAQPIPKPPPAPTADLSSTELPVPPPPFSEDIFPCSMCHSEMETNLTRRKLTDEHDTIVLKHGPRERWCFDCHNPDDRDQLRLASGTLVPYTESYRLCGQCHGDKLRDWKAGVHGKRTGYWNGKKQYLLCAHCHNPHSPRFAPMKPMPAPTRPENLR
jgi:hypothetical protein